MTAENTKTSKNQEWSTPLKHCFSLFAPFADFRTTKVFMFENFPTIF